MKVFKITTAFDINPCCECAAMKALVWLEEAVVGDIITVEILEMPEEEYDKLPEYMGP